MCTNPVWMPRRKTNQLCLIKAHYYFIVLANDLSGLDQTNTLEWITINELN